MAHQNPMPHHFPKNTNPSEYVEKPNLSFVSWKDEKERRKKLPRPHNQSQNCSKLLRTYKQTGNPAKPTQSNPKQPANQPAYTNPNTCCPALTSLQNCTKSAQGQAFVQNLQTLSIQSKNLLQTCPCTSWQNKNYNQKATVQSRRISSL